VDYVLDLYKKPFGGISNNMCGRDLILLEYASDSADGEGSVRGPLTYAQKMRDTNTYAGNTELFALAAMLDVLIIVHYLNLDAGSITVDPKKRGSVQSIVLHVVFDPQTKHYSPILRDFHASKEVDTTASKAE
jgi:hypothetical protein